MLTREKLLELLEQHGLSHRADEILSQCKQSIHLSLQYGVDEANIPIGASKMGGSPDVPPDFVWPEWNGISLTFIAQFRLSDVKPYDVEDLLPESGMLYFFFEKYAFFEDVGDLLYSSDGPYKVMYFENETTLLKRIEHPIAFSKTYGEIERYNACPIQFEVELSLPTLTTLYDLFFKLDGLRTREWDWYFAIEKHYAQPKHRMLGHETDIQWDGELKGAAETAYDLEGNWMLLLQVDTDDAPNFADKSKPNFFWNDNGCIYYFIREDDLRIHNFDRIWQYLLCY